MSILSAMTSPRKRMAMIAAMAFAALGTVTWATGQYISGQGVQGTSPATMAYKGNPVVVAGVDGSGNTQYLNIDGSGNLKVTSSGGVSSTITSPLGNHTAAASVATTLNGQGQQTAANSSSVVLASDTGNVPTNLAQVSGTALLTGAGATGAGSQRVTVAQDATTIAGSAVGTAGSASANVVSVQGIGGGTALPVSGTVTANAGTGTMATNMTQINGVSNQASALNTQATISVANTATVLLATNSNRHGFLIINNDATTDIYVGNTSVVSGATAQANGGVLVKHGGGSMSMVMLGGYTGPVDGITAASTAVVAVLEW